MESVKGSLLVSAWIAAYCGAKLAAWWRRHDTPSNLPELACWPLHYLWRLLTYPWRHQ